jgi:hypothetical protein
MTTISLQTAQQLQQVAKEHNYTLPESEYFWIKDIDNNYTVNKIIELVEPDRENQELGKPTEWTIVAVAYTIEELFKHIPYTINNGYYVLIITQTDKSFKCSYCQYDDVLNEYYDFHIEIEHELLLECLNNLYAYLIENELIKN